MVENEMLRDEDTADVATKAEGERATLTRAVREFDVAKAVTWS